MSALTETIRQLTWHQQSVTLDRQTVCAAEEHINALMDAISNIVLCSGANDAGSLANAINDARKLLTKE